MTETPLTLAQEIELLDGYLLLYCSEFTNFVAEAKEYKKAWEIIEALEGRLKLARDAVERAIQYSEQCRWDEYFLAEMKEAQRDSSLDQPLQTEAQ